MQGVRGRDGRAARMGQLHFADTMDSPYRADIILPPYRRRMTSSA